MLLQPWFFLLFLKVVHSEGTKTAKNSPASSRNSKSSVETTLLTPEQHPLPIKPIVDTAPSIATNIPVNPTKMPPSETTTAGHPLDSNHTTIIELILILMCISLSFWIVNALTSCCKDDDDHCHAIEFQVHYCCCRCCPRGFWFRFPPLPPEGPVDEFGNPVPRSQRRTRMTATESSDTPSLVFLRDWGMDAPGCDGVERYPASLTAYAGKTPGANVGRLKVGETYILPVATKIRNSKSVSLVRTASRTQDSVRTLSVSENLFRPVAQGHQSSSAEARTCQVDVLRDSEPHV